jgi:phosphoadenosine phosphosulfate reductase
MFKVKWDKENNGFIISNNITDNNVISPPRPVFYEELDLLGFNKHWDYPQSEEPLLWAIGRKYYYKGILVAEANGGNLYDKPNLKIIHKCKLEPVDLDLLIKKNLSSIRIIEGEAVDFIQEIYKKYKKKGIQFAVAFSCGKDSQVVLDLVSRVIAPKNYHTIYSDTGMEIPFNNEIVEYTVNEYEKKYKNFNFHIAKSNLDIFDLWRYFGTPSRIHRWCCSVSKTVPFAIKIKEIFNNNNKYVTFEGVRAEESSRRNKYSRLTTSSVKTKQINAEVILNWNLAEVFLYLFYRKIKLNRGYRYGLTRVGCSMCPFSSQWSEFIMYRIAPSYMSRFIKIIEEQTSPEVNSTDNLNDYIKNGQWKMRSGGRNLLVSSYKEIKQSTDIKLDYVLKDPKTDILIWLSILGDIRSWIKKGKIYGEIKHDSTLINFEISKEEKLVIATFTFSGDKIIKNRIDKVINKATYCVGCSACQIECPFGAIDFHPYFKISREKCLHCLKCLAFTEKGCLRAKSINITDGGKNMNDEKIATSKYQTFGLRDLWIKSFLSKSNNWFTQNPAGLGNRQIQSVVAWLRDANVIDNKNALTNFGEKLVSIQDDERIVWSLIWVNLFYNINLIKWYLKDIKWGEKYTTKELVELIQIKSSINKAKTTSNAISSMVNMFDQSNLGKDLKIGVLSKKGTVRSVSKIGSDLISYEVIAYSLYKYAEERGRFKFTVSEFFNDECNGGPRFLFGISKDYFEKNLRLLQEEKNKLVKVNLVAGLDNIFLREDINSNDVLELLLKK